MAHKYVLAIDQGTTSSRAIIFDHAGNIVALSSAEHRQIHPQPGWVEHDALEIWANIERVVGQACQALPIEPAKPPAALKDIIAAVGITNQRETLVVWDKNTGQPIHNAIVWQDTRTQPFCDELAAASDQGTARYQQLTGLPLATYFSATKLRWILDHVPGAAARAQAGDLLCGTMDTWVIWRLTGGGVPGQPANLSDGAPGGSQPKDSSRVGGGVYVTDVTNASRTQLMDLRTLQWDQGLCADFGVPMAMLPQIRSCAEVYGHVPDTVLSGVLAGVPVAAALGDQQAATFGQACFTPGMAKNTYGTGCFMLLNTGNKPVFSDNGLLSTVCYQLGGQAPVYALEGSVAVAGSLVQWLRDALELIADAPQVESLARQVEDNGGCCIVPAFSGLFAPHWRPDARGVIVGLTSYVTKAHLARAALEAVAFQVWELLQAMNADAGVDLRQLRVDGGMSVNELLMQFQADILGVEVVAPQVVETTALGAAYAAGIAVGFWDGPEEVSANWEQRQNWQPAMPATQRDELLSQWKKAVTKTLNWLD